MNNSGSILIFGYSFMLGLLIFLLGLYLAPAIFESSNSARGNSTDTSIGLGCDNESISTFDHVTCYASDLTSFYFVGFLVFIGLAAIGGRILFS